MPGHFLLPTEHGEARQQEAWPLPPGLSEARDDPLSLLYRNIQPKLALLPFPPEVLPPGAEGQRAVQGDNGEDLSDEVHLLQLWQRLPHQQSPGAPYGGGS